MKTMVILDRDEQKEIIRRRRAMGGDRYDEVWNGVYVTSPLADNEHQELAGKLSSAIDQALGSPEAIRVFPGVNVSDQPEKWKKNYRCPDVAVYLPGNPAEDRGTHWLGGPDFAVEIISPNDRARKKFSFYASVGVRELVLLDRRPWRLELYRLQDGQFRLVGTSSLEQSEVLESTVLNLRFRLVPGGKRPRIEVIALDGTRRWLA
jgi:Uma2 family endonuclease